LPVHQEASAATTRARLLARWTTTLVISAISSSVRMEKRLSPQVRTRALALAATFGRHWNAHVSPGEPLYAHRGEGQRLLEQARRDARIPQGPIHRKEVFL
jgi:hypothetical protein